MLRRLWVLASTITSAVLLASCGSALQAITPANAPVHDAPISSAQRSIASTSVSLTTWDKRSIQMVIRPQAVASAAPVAASPISPKQPMIVCPLASGRTATPNIVCCNGDCPPLSTPTPRPVAYAQVTVNVPAPQGGARRVPLIGTPRLYKPNVVSPSTNSVQLSITNPAPGYASTYAADCVPNSDGTKTCTINNIAAQPGTTGTYTGSLYTGAQETGQLLGRGSTTAPIIAGQNNVIAITISPVVVEVGFDFTTNVSSSSSFNLVLSPGSSQTFPLTIAAYDPEGNVIPTPAQGSQYLDTTATPFTIGATVTLDPSSPPGTITLSGSTFTAPSSPTVTGTYSGAPLGNGASISTSVTTSDPNVFVDPPVTITHP